MMWTIAAATTISTSTRAALTISKIASCRWVYSGRFFPFHKENTPMVTSYCTIVIRYYSMSVSGSSVPLPSEHYYLDYVVPFGNIHPSTYHSKDSFSCRFFSSYPKTKSSSSSSILLRNESLRFVLTEKGKVSSDTVQVRVVVATDLLLTEEKSSSSATGPTTSIVSTLSHALDIAQRHQMDLIGVQLSQTPPVVKVMEKADLKQNDNKSNVSTVSSSKISQGNQQQWQPVASGKKKVTTPTTTVKEFKFKVGIAENDLVRKLQQVKANLQKGYTCQVSIFCPKRFYKEEEEGGGTGGGYNSNNYNIDQRIYEHVEEFLLQEPKVKRNKNTTTIVLQPKQILTKDKN